MLVTGLLIAGYRVIGYQATWLLAGYRVTVHRFMVSPLVACCGLSNNKSWHACMHFEFMVHRYNRPAQSLGQPGRLCSSAMHQFSPHCRIRKNPVGYA